MSHPKLIIGGGALDISHLNPIDRKVTLELRGGFTKSVAVRFEFSSHCYSRALGDNATALPGHAFDDGSRRTPRPRVFDQERYALSLQLVHMIDNLISTNGTVIETRHENFFQIECVDTFRQGVQTQVDYFIFMHSRKLAPINQQKSIRVFVESAYPALAGVPHPGGGGARSLGRMLGECW